MMAEDKEIKKVSLAEAAKQLLEKKKQAQAKGSNNSKFQNKEVQTMKSQITKKPNNQSRRTGV